MSVQISVKLSIEFFYEHDHFCTLTTRSVVFQPNGILFTAVTVRTGRTSTTIYKVRYQIIVISCYTK
jgi:hypothetical protein